MRIVTYNKEMRITNTDQLQSGTSSRYLEVREPHEIGLPLIAVQWRRKKPRTLPTKHALIEFQSKLK